MKPIDHSRLPSPPSMPFISSFNKIFVSRPSYLLQNALLELPLDPLTLLIRGGLAVERHERTEVELRRLEELHLADVDLRHVSIHGTRQIRNSQENENPQKNQKQ